MNPEFLREGSSVSDFFDPPKTVIGQFDEASGDAVAELYEGLPGPVYRVPLAVAEMIKYADNSFHALKVGFANEMGAVCKALGLDSHAVMDILIADTKLNISPAYLRPGFAFGGSCLPKDLRAVVHRARRADVPVPILESIVPSNEGQIDRVFKIIEATGKRRVGLLGLAFKPGTDDLRESPLVALAERLLGRGFELLIHDPQVAVSRLLGANRAYVDQRIPHLSRLMAGSRRRGRQPRGGLRGGRSGPRGNRRPQACRWSHRGRLGTFPRLGGLRRRPPVHRHQLVAAPSEVMGHIGHVIVPGASVVGVGEVFGLLHKRAVLA